MRTVPRPRTHPARTHPRGKLACFVRAFVIAYLLVPASPAWAAFITKGEALARPDLVRVAGRWDTQYRVKAARDRTYDMRTFVSTSVPADEDTAVSIGKDAPAEGTVVVGPKILGAIDRTLTWQEVKSRYDGEGLRLEGTGWMAVFGLRVDNVEDGFAPRTRDGAQQDSSDRFLLEHAYMSYIRDDCVEDDDLLSGVIRDSFFDGCNRFLSSRPSSDTSYSNHGQLVSVRNTLVHMVAMPHEDAVDGDGTAHGAPFKWDDTAGRVELRNVIFLVDERPISSDDAIRFPAGTFDNVVIVLGPRFDGDRDGDVVEKDWPVAIPEGVRITRNMRLWSDAVDDWFLADRSTRDHKA